MHAALPHALAPTSDPASCALPLPPPQVRQKLYSGSVLRFRRYARHLAPLLRPLRQLILRYESETGLDSSQQLLEEVLDSSNGSGGEGSGDSGGRRNRDEL